MIYNISEIRVGAANISSGYVGGNIVFPKQEAGNPILIRIGTPTTVFELKNGDGEQFPFGPNVVDSNTIPYWNGEQPDPNPCGILSNAGGISSIEFTDNVIEIYEPFESMYDDCFHEYTGEIDLSDATELGYIAAHSFNGVSASAITFPSDAENVIQYIGDDAFGSCMNLTGISIPNGVYDYIGDETFVGCTSLTTAKLPTGYSLIPNAMFAGCMSLTGINIPSGYREIGASAFADCNALSSVTIPEGITQIGHVVDDREFDNNGYAFANCALTSVTIPASVQAIAEYSFGNLRNLEWIEFKGTTPPQHGDNVFHNIEEIIQERGENIPIYVPCSALNAYKEQWSEYATLFECKETGKATLTLSNGQTVTIPGSGILTSAETQPYIANTVSAELTTACTSIGDGAFQGSLGSVLTSVTIPDSVTSIGDLAFYYCQMLTGVTIPSGVTSIGVDAFYQCPGLTEITINATTPPTLGPAAFDETNNCPIYVPCESLLNYKKASVWSTYESRLTCPYTGKAIITTGGYGGKKVYYVPGNGPISSYEVDDYSAMTLVELCSGCTGVSNGAFKRDMSRPTYTIMGAVTMADSVTGIGRQAFFRCELLNSITLGNRLTSIGASAFTHCSGLTSIVIPDSVTSIDNLAFSACTSLSSVTLGNGLTSINPGTFGGCGSLTGITIPSGVTTIEDAAFSYCSGLTSVTIPDSVTSLGGFDYCRNLTSVTIPSGVTYLGNKAFYYCDKLTSITINAIIPPTMVACNYAFDYTNDCPIYVPAESVEAYKTADGEWPRYADRIQAIP